MSRDPRDAIAGIASLVGAAGAGGGVGAALDEALDVLVTATGCRAAAYFAGRPEEPAGMVLRARRGEPEALAGIASAIRAASAPLPATALRLGEVVGGPGAAGALEALGLPGGVLVPAVIDGHTEGALALLPSDGAAPDGPDIAAGRAAAALIALGMRTDTLVRGLGDRARELDRQSRRLGALTRVAQRLAEAPTAAAVRDVTVSEARALAGADAAALLVPGPAGAVEEAARDGEGPVAADPAAVAAVAAGGAPRLAGRVALAAIVDPPGALAVARADPPLDAGDLERLQGLAAQASVALARGRLVDDLRREQAERRTLAAAIVSAQEDERRRVAEDIHDGPVQGLSAVGLLLDALVARLRDEAPEAVGEASAAAAAAREAVRELRRAISDLHPVALGDLGLASATRALVERLEWRGVAVAVDVDAADALPETARTVAFRVLQEAVANILRHSGAGQVTITARRAGGNVVVEVHDDGRGLSPGDRRRRVAEGHLGLAAIEERAALAGGRLDVESGEGRGTLLRLTLPAGEGDAQSGVPPTRASAAESASSSAKRSSTTT
ncbi:MAG: sensor histidine kinase [Thermoleophilia bacterium]